MTLAPLPGLGDLPDQPRPRVTCRMCGRRLVDREARTWGLGAECRTRLALRAAPLPPQVEIEQEMLPGT